MRDEDFLTEAVKRGFIKEDQVQTVLKTQREISAKGLSIDLPQIMVMKGMMTSVQADSIKAGSKPKSQAFGPYEIAGKLGEGGMGIVYRAVRSDNPNRPVALKIMHQRMTSDEQSNLRFKREAAILVQMKHPHVVQGYDFGEINGRLYVAMELLEGKQVSRMIKERGHLEEKAVLKIGLDIAHALEFVASQGLVHRDIKPDNIMILDTGVSKLMDLGLMKSAGADAVGLAVTAPGMTIGTPTYMSLEHITGDRNLDIRTDIYGLGATMFHAVTGTKPFEAESPFEIIRKKKEEPVPDARKRSKNVSAGMAALLQCMMARDRERRHATPQDLVSDIRLVLTGQPPAWRPKSTGEVSKVPAPARPAAPRSPSRPVAHVPAPKKKSAWSAWGPILLILAGLACAAAAFYFFKLKR